MAVAVIVEVEVAKRKNLAFLWFTLSPSLDGIWISLSLKKEYSLHLKIMDLLLFGSYTRLSFTLIK